MENQVERSLVFVSSPATLIFGIVLVLATLVFSLLAWKRSGYARWTGVLELIRMAIVILVAITLNQPELHELRTPDRKPVLAVLWDKSDSMETRDMLVEEEGAEPKPVTRGDYLKPFLEEEVWWPLGNSIRTVIEPFSSENDPPSSGTDLNSALERTLEQHPMLRSVVLFSDGDWNTGEPPIRTASKLGICDVPVFVVPVGSDTRFPDIEVRSFDAPTYAVAGKPLRIPFVIDSSMPRDQRTEIELTTSTGETITESVTVPAMNQIQEAITWTPTEPGDVELTLTVSSAEKELLTDNNIVTAPISIREEKLKVLLIESYPRWEYRYLRNALERDPGVEVSCLLFHPDLDATGGGRGYIKAFPEDEDLVTYDVVFLGDVGVGPDQLSVEQCNRLVKLVSNQASGLVFLPGLRGRHFSLMETDLVDLYPVILDESQPRGWGSQLPGQFQLTEKGGRSLLTKLDETEAENLEVWESLPGFQWFAPIVRAKAGTEVLASHASESTDFGRVPLIVTKTYGAGKILFMGTDGAWRWREGVEDRYHYRFWGQVARWMAYQRNMAQGELMRLFYSPDRPQTNEVLTLNANVMSNSGEPLQDATVIVQLEGPDGKPQSVRLRSSGEDSWGLFTGRFIPPKPGEYKVVMTCKENEARLETTISVQGTVSEKIGRPLRMEVLQEIAQVTGGQVIEQPSMEDILATIGNLPEPPPSIIAIPIWSHWGWGLLLLVLLTAFWIGRKVAGVI